MNSQLVHCASIFRSIVLLKEGTTRDKDNDGLVNALAFALQSCVRDRVPIRGRPSLNAERGFLKRLRPYRWRDLYSSQTEPFVSWTRNCKPSSHETV